MLTRRVSKEKRGAGRTILAGIFIVLALFIAALGTGILLAADSGSVKEIVIAVSPEIIDEVKSAASDVAGSTESLKITIDFIPLARTQGEEAIRKGTARFGVFLDTSSLTHVNEGTFDKTTFGNGSRDNDTDIGLGAHREKDGIRFVRIGFRPFFFFTPMFSPKQGISMDEAIGLLETGMASERDDDATRDLYGDKLIVRGSFDEIPVGFRPLAVDGVVPTPENVKTGEYPVICPIEFAVENVPQSPLNEFFDRFLNLVSRVIFPSRAALVESERHILEALQSSMLTEPNAIVISAVGDVMLSRRVGKMMETLGNDYPFGDVKGVFSKSDLVVANLESPIGVTGRPIPNKMIWFRAKPQAAEALKDAGIDVVCLANNHILDYDTENLLETMDILDQAQIGYFGAGRNLEEARRPLIVNVNGIRVAFLGYSEFARPGLYWSTAYRRSFDATPTTPGCAPLDPDYIKEDIAKVKSQSDVVMVMVHWGAEDTNVPLPFIEDQRKIAKLILESGADVLLGTHPHALQGLEVIGDGLCAYSLGNFVMDQKREIQKESMILDMYISMSGLSGINVHPVYIDDCRPRVLEGKPALDLLSKLRDISMVLTER
jgi:poly-gamma-glutamate capsule biosynthesis protein CapA/YwtB (metallophosphatase superfamily)